VVAIGIKIVGTLLVGFQEFGNFYAAYAARNFQSLPQRNENLPIRGESISLSDISEKKAFSPAALAMQLDEEGFRKRLAEKTRNLKKGENRVGFPAVLGLKNAEKVKADQAIDFPADI
jgi:anaerobic glycerol-3-phosphate dehydrogenase